MTLDIWLDMKIMVIGANGSLGSEICSQLSKKEVHVIPVTRNELDVTVKINLLKSFIIICYNVTCNYLR